jgi:hypothetical protein
MVGLFRWAVWLAKCLHLASLFMQLQNMLSMVTSTHFVLRFAPRYSLESIEQKWCCFEFKASKLIHTRILNEIPVTKRMYFGNRKDSSGDHMLSWWVLLNRSTNKESRSLWFVQGQLIPQHWHLQTLSW